MLRGLHRVRQPRIIGSQEDGQEADLSLRRRWDEERQLQEDFVSAVVAEARVHDAQPPDLGVAQSGSLAEAFVLVVALLGDGVAEEEAEIGHF